jgi:ketosteroid isomerase-like protein
MRMPASRITDRPANDGAFRITHHPVSSPMNPYKCLTRHLGRPSFGGDSASFAPEGTSRLTVPTHFLATASSAPFPEKSRRTEESFAANVGFMIDEAIVRDWVERYIKAWNSNDPSEIGELFTANGVYVSGPFDEPWHGRETIVTNWLGRKDEPGDTQFTYDVIAVDGDLGVVEAKTVYFDPPYEFGNLWLVRLNDAGQCTHYTEYWMEKK